MIDLGAHVGYFSLRVADRVRQGVTARATIAMLEGHPETFDTLATRWKQQPLDSRTTVRLVRGLAGARAGVAPLTTEAFTGRLAHRRRRGERDGCSLRRSRHRGAGDRADRPAQVRCRGRRRPGDCRVPGYCCHGCSTPHSSFIRAGSTWTACCVNLRPRDFARQGWSRRRLTVRCVCSADERLSPDTSCAAGTRQEFLSLLAAVVRGETPVWPVAAEFG